ncbi:MAG TPA: phosphoribosylamine--glycine ligase [Chloroflexota bacterium]|nr:phosphoribosylamine--glycine ligase [Chloroflexota bacterium]
MRVLVVGGGAREHALVWKLRFCPQVTAVYAAPGNAGISFLAHTEPVRADDIGGLLNMAREYQIDLTIVGPEAPLAAGIVDVFQQAHQRIFGPNRAAAQIEASKIWAKQLMDRNHIPTARWSLAGDPDEARSYVREFGIPVVLKADGLAGGKGAVVCHTPDEAEATIRDFMVNATLGEAGKRLVVEEFLEGVELSVFGLADGRTVVPLIGARDYKRLEDGDRGPNTGGMGGYAPPSYATADVLRSVNDTILAPTVQAMAAEGTPYVGVLYAGLMMTTDGPKVLEFNGRWGDPEAQLVLPLLKSDLAELMDACIDGQLGGAAVDWVEGATCGVVLASPGYPHAPQTGSKIEGLDDIDEGVFAFHGATRVLKTPEPNRGWLRRGVRRTTDADIGFFTDGGRVLTVVARGASVAEARTRAYANVDRIHFDGMQYRRDIAAQEPEPRDAPRPLTREADAMAAQSAAPTRIDPVTAPRETSTTAEPREHKSAMLERDVMPLVSVLMGSESDRPIMEETAKVLDALGIPHEVHVMSAHRTPERVREFARTARERGIEVIIAGAGGAAHLPGVLAAQTTLPVIGVPIPGSSLGGLDSLLSIVQMPGGVPVATVATGNAGARNAGYLAASILSLAHDEIGARYRTFRRDQSGGDLA